MRRCFPLLLTFASLACTGGKVISRSGESVGGLTVRFFNCKKSFVTTTLSDGTYYFNPYSFHSPDLDESQLVDEGPMEVEVTGNGRLHTYQLNHQFNRTCPVPYDGENSVQQPCSLDNLVIASPSTVLPANDVGPQGEPNHHPGLRLGYCGFNQACIQAELKVKLNRVRHQTQKCSISNIL